ncbi:hypothetical protein [Haloarcula pellucida]|uniref:Uncharacterized protein n=1 Tax=Haloarcula pellucida TaxID=1427151 RepID=A0A830GS34_9EURY|nr:hypothetical protein [Halomicroarcula pellucida]MBX0350379.1 hypothetical protein [Halomicroarcula pellucida]GGO01794.1 hypothetical protein GCM10009030_35830 [Halomicroarcula pellucida]
MPVVEKTSGARVTIRDIGEFTHGDRADVGAADAAYLCDERGDFERVDDAVAAEDGPADEDVHEEDGPPDGAGPIPDPSDHSVADLRDKLSDIDDVDVLAAVYDAEEAGKDRDTAIEAIQGRINAVRED